MPRDRDELTRDADELEAQLDEELKGELDEEEQRAARAREETAEERAIRVGARAMRHLEARKDSPETMGAEVSQRYLDMGRELLSDPGAVRRLPKNLRGRVGQMLGRDPGDVRIHTGERAQAAADALGARAFAVGDRDIYFGRGQFAPETREGMGVLVHELTHVADSQMKGAAFSSADGGTAGTSTSERRARQAETFATERGESQQQVDEAVEADSFSERDIDIEKLEAAIVKIISRDEHRAADRTGHSGQIMQE